MKERSEYVGHRALVVVYILEEFTSRHFQVCIVIYWRQLKPDVQCLGQEHRSQ
jgi:hypothetical protein